jgi:AcrR family transcriptional regulator
MDGVSITEVSPRRLSARQSGVVDDLVDAAEVEAAEGGYDGLTVRNVAKRAGVAPATAYTYFSSKDHVLAELLWRRVRDVPEPIVDPTQSVAERLEVTVSDLGAIAGGSPDVVAACTQALLSNSPDVRDLRLKIGAEFHRRLTRAAQGQIENKVVTILVTTYFGALLSAGMGHMDFAEVPGFVAEAARLMSSTTSPRSSSAVSVVR